MTCSGAGLIDVNGGKKALIKIHGGLKLLALAPWCAFGTGAHSVFCLSAAKINK